MWLYRLYLVPGVWKMGSIGKSTTGCGADCLSQRALNISGHSTLPRNPALISCALCLPHAVKVPAGDAAKGERTSAMAELWFKVSRCRPAGAKIFKTKCSQCH